MAEALRALVTFYQTGETADREAYDIAWVQRQGVAGRHDQRVRRGLSRRPRHQGRVGSARLLRERREDLGDPRRSRQHAQWFEDRMPWDPKCRKPGVRGVTANAIDGRHRDRRLGPDHAGRHQPAERSGGSANSYGSKSVSLSNVNEAYDKSTLPEFRSEFSWTAGGSRRARSKWSALGRRADDEHARGDRPRVGQGRRAAARAIRRRRCKEQFSALEESRADLVALYFLPDPQARRDRRLSAATITTTIVRAEYEATRATRSCSCAASARARRSKKITCATAR